MTKNICNTFESSMTKLAGSLLLLSFATAMIAGCGGGAAAKKDSTYSTSGSQEADQRADQRMARDAQLKGGNEQQQSLGNKMGGGEKTGPNGVSKADEKKTLYDRIGGEESVKALVDDWTTRILADPQVNLARKGVTRGGLSIHRGQSMEWDVTGANLNIFKRNVAQFISLKTGGPTAYTGPDLKEISDGRHFSNAEFDAAIGDLKQTMDKLKLPNQEQKELIAIVESTRTQLAEDR